MRIKRHFRYIFSWYPQRVGFKFWRKTWPEQCYYVVKDMKLKDWGHGRAFGILYWKGIQQNNTPVRIRNGNKRGIWRYDINNAKATLDNGLHYSTQELLAYKNSRSYKINSEIQKQQEQQQEEETQEEK
ncbi:hypothetical protein IMG5_152110 [Ichthyophthirius multifiliis]|uniref:Uncharacterized protein n=1 Tax=Ichthyophthirius multifiliis TaxID=5932 RepID=G0QYT5_ICHMU|nr:hypothetical protein IMG5_152110 [Ichthyophthirius multifiliis]EGR29610.1 hypothetical protein IMG5_152110 [Ichthyophthirius multifiliis]|eukprot:XP_004030846.1 hypothetical protein IMG5_152110 [Ichthyophthirius multifiliis]